MEITNKSYIDFIKRLQLKLDGRLALTGSRVFSINGLVTIEDNSDIDLILFESTDKDKEFLKNLSELSPIYSSSSYMIESGKWEVKYQFNLDSFKVDILIEDGSPDNFTCFQGVLLNPIYRIIEANKRMNRKKDWMKLLEISQKFINFDELKIHLIQK